MTTKTVCSVDGCSRAASCRGWCRMHYSRWRRHGDPTVALANFGPLRDRVFARLNVDGPVPEARPDLGPCWIWAGALHVGYGVIGLRGEDQERFGGRHTVEGHRVLYTLEVGPIPEGMTLDHLCRVTACARPSHLDPVPIGENVRRGTGIFVRNSRKTHCVNGHEFTPENTRLRTRPEGGRICRTCAAEREARRRAA